MYGDAHTVGPVHPVPPHWPYSACVPAVEVAVAAVVVLTLVVKVVAGLVVVGTVVPAAAASKLSTVAYAGLVVRFAQ